MLLEAKTQNTLVIRFLDCKLMLSQSSLNTMVFFYLWSHPTPNPGPPRDGPVGLTFISEGHASSDM